MKEWFKSKTVWFGFLIGFLGVVQATLETAPLDPEISGVILSGIGALTVFLRSITNTALR